MGRFAMIGLWVAVMSVCWSMTYADGQSIEVTITNITFGDETDFMQFDGEISDEESKWVGTLEVKQDIFCNASRFFGVLYSCPEPRTNCKVFRKVMKKLCLVAKKTDNPFETNIGRLFASAEGLVIGESIPQGTYDINGYDLMTHEDANGKDSSNYWWVDWKIKYYRDVIFSMEEDVNIEDEN